MLGHQEEATRKPGPLLPLFFLLVCTSCSLTGPGDTDSLVAELDERIPPVVAAGNAPSMQVAVIQGDEIAWSRAFGESTSVDQVYMIASVQKTVTAVAVLQLVDAGLIDLDTDVGEYVPFPVRHPDYPETPITVRMLVAHRSGLGYLPHQFAWDTGVVSAGYRPACPEELSEMTLEEYVEASLTPGGVNYDPAAWVREPDQGYHYSVGAYPLLRYLVGRVAGSSYAAYLRESIFDPLGMTSSGFSVEEFAGRHAIPYTRINGENIELPLWDGRGSLVHTTADDMARFMLALMHDGRSGDVQLLQPETVELMRRTTSKFRLLFKGGGEDLQRTAQGLGSLAFPGRLVRHRRVGAGLPVPLPFPPRPAGRLRAADQRQRHPRRRRQLRIRPARDLRGAGCSWCRCSTRPTGYAAGPPRSASSRGWSSSPS